MGNSITHGAFFLLCRRYVNYFVADNNFWFFVYLQLRELRNSPYKKKYLELNFEETQSSITHHLDTDKTKKRQYLTI